jgi:hypothetical protein
MTFSYSGDPGASTLDLVRFLIQDTNEDDAQLQDAEILYWIGQFDGEAYSAAISCVSSLIGRLASLSSESKTVGDLSLSRVNGMQVAKFEALIKYLERERFRRFPAAPAANPNALLPTGVGIVEGEGTDFYTGQMDNRT